MSLPIILRPEAQDDVLETRDWYDGQQPGFGDAFNDALKEFIERIRATPETYSLALKNVRRGKLRRFPYVVYYRILDDRVEVIAVLHGRRDPRVWQSRA